MNPDIEIERKNCKFDVNEFTLCWVGGKKKMDEKRTRGEFYIIT